VNINSLSSCLSCPFSGTGSTASAFCPWPVPAFFSGQGSLPGSCIHVTSTQNKLVRQDFPSQRPRWFFLYRLCLSVCSVISSFNRDSSSSQQMKDRLSGLQLQDPLWSPVCGLDSQWQSSRFLAQWLLVMVGYTFWAAAQQFHIWVPSQLLGEWLPILVTYWHLSYSLRSNIFSVLSTNWYSSPDRSAMKNTLDVGNSPTSLTFKRNYTKNKSHILCCDLILKCHFNTSVIRWSRCFMSWLPVSEVFRDLFIINPSIFY